MTMKKKSSFFKSQWLICIINKKMAKKVQKKPGNVPEGAPAGIFINAQYLKDLSFENPNPLEAYKNDEKPDIKVNINTLVKKLPDNAFEGIVMDPEAGVPVVFLSVYTVSSWSSKSPSWLKSMKTAYPSV